MSKNVELELKLVKSGEFLGTKCDFYLDEENNNVYMTRNQIGEALEYANPDDALSKIHRRNSDRLDGFSVVAKLSSTDNKEYKTTIYNYQGIYEITFMSRKPVATNFRDWVMGEIEMIRKTGMAMPNPELAVKEVFSDLDEELQVAIVENYKSKLVEVNKELEEAKPKVERWDAFMNSDGHLTISDFAKSLNIKGIGRNNMCRLLRDKSILMDSAGNKNVPYQTLIDRGYFTTVASERNGMIFNVSLISTKGANWLFGKMKEWEVIL